MRETEHHPATTVRGGFAIGLPWLIGIFAIGASYGLLKGVAYHEPLTNNLTLLIISTLLGVPLVGLSVLAFAVRKAVGSPEGVEVWMGLSHFTVPWGAFVRPEQPYHLGFTLEWKQEGEPGGTRWINVSKRLAGAVVSDPNWPYNSMSSEIWRSLDLSPPARHDAC